MFHIRHALSSDLTGILNITNHEIINGTAFWMSVPRTLKEQEDWFETRKKSNFPIFVAVDSTQKILGYGSYGPFRAYDGYRHSVEHSVYVHPQAQKQGIGKKLLENLIHYASNHHIHTMIACITEDNQPSIRLHEWFGFKIAGVLPETGIKFDRWLNLLFMYKILLPNN